MADRVQIPYSGGQPIICPICMTAVAVRVDVEFSAESVSSALSGLDLSTGEVNVKTNIKGASFNHACVAPGVEVPSA